MFKSKLIIALSVLLLIFSLLNAQVDKPEESVVDITLEQNGKQGTVSATYKIPDGFHQTLQKDYFFLKVEDMPGITFSETIYPEGEKDADGYIEYKGKITLTKKFTIEGQIKTLEFKAVAGYQFCEDGGSCFFPEEKELLVKIDVKEKSMEEPVKQKEDKLEQSKTNGTSGINKFLGMNIWYILLLIIIGGVALNLTPCVLPMVPITIAVLGAGTQAESKGKGFLIGSLYGIGMTLAYGTLGLIVIFTGSRFGAINSSPWFNIIIAIVFIFLSLAMFDIIPIDFSKYQSSKISGKKSGKSKYITVFILGVIAAVLAGACVAPVLISVLLYSIALYSAGNPAGLLLPFLLGLGMALPWPFVGAGMSVLPKPGNWMKWIKIVFGIIILIVALYYGYTGIHLMSTKSHETSVGSQKASFPKIKEKLDDFKLLNSAAGYLKADQFVYFVQDAATPVEEKAEVKDSVKLDWNHSLIEGLDKAKKENKPVLIDFWASWCKNCLTMDATTFKNKSVHAALEYYILVKYQAEDLEASPNKEVLDYFDVLGLPTYVIITPKGNQ